MSHWRAAAKMLLLLITAVAIFSPGFVRAGNPDSITLSFTPSDIWPPIAITNLSALAGGREGEVQLTWTAPYENDAFPGSGAVEGYYIEYDAFSISDLGGDTTAWWNTAGGWQQITFANEPGQTEQETIDSLWPGTTYYFAIKSYDDASPPNESPIDTRAASVVNQAYCMVPDTPPATPKGLTALAGAGEVVLSWTELTPDEKGIDFDYYKIYRSSISPSFLSAIGTTTLTVYFDTGLQYNTTYYYAISAVDQPPLVLESALSDVVAVWVRKVPDDPTLVLKDRTTGNPNYTDEQLVDVEVGNDDDATQWLISETQPTQPTEDDPDWGSEPTTFTLSIGDGLKTVYIWIKNAAGDINTGPVSATITLDTTGPAIYLIRSDVLRAKTTESFKLTIELVNSDTGEPKDGADNPFIITACTVGGEDAPGNWIKISGPSRLSDGRAEIWVSYDTVGKIRFKVSDDFGHPEAYTDVIEIEPVGLRYHLEAPGTVQAGEEFPLKVKLVDTGAGNPVTPSEYARQVNLVAYSSPVGTPAEGELKVKSFYLQGGEKTLLQSYSLAHIIYIEASDAKVYTPASALGRTADIEVIGVPKTVMKFDGMYREMHDGIYLRSSTRIIIMSVTDIVAETILYRDNDGDWKTYVEPFTLSPGAHTIEYYGIDKYEHKERINRSKKIYVTFFGGGVINIPNPFKAGREETWIEYDLEEPSNVTITIYDLFGQEVWHKNYAAGENGGKEVDNSIPWDGRNLSGKVVANGGYICRIWVEKEKRHMVRKIAVAK